MDTAPERKGGSETLSACSSQKYGNQGQVQTLASSIKWQGFFLHTLLRFGSVTESAPAMPMSLGNQPPASGNDTPKLEEYQGACEIQTKARASQTAEQSPKNLMRPHHLQTQPTMAGMTV